MFILFLRIQLPGDPYGLLIDVLWVCFIGVEQVYDFRCASE